MLARLIFIFSLVTLIFLAVKKGFSPSEEVFQRAPGYPEPVALNQVKTVSDAEYLASLPSAKDYALAFSEPLQEIIPKQEITPKKLVKPKRTVATKNKIQLKKRFVKR